MKLLSTIVGLVLLSGAAFADHDLPAGSIRELDYATYQLNYRVQYSSLRYHVKQAVHQFAWTVQNFVRCTGGRSGSWDHDTVPLNCLYQLHQVHRSWHPVERYLYDTYYDYPAVYRAYLRARSAVHRVHVNE